MKFAGSILLLWAGLLGGCAAARQLDRRTAHIRTLRQLITRMMTELRSSLPLIAELLRETAAEAQFRQLAFLQQAAAEAAQFPESWDAALSADSALSPEELSVLQTVGQTLGSMPLDGQLAALQLCLERLAQLQADAELCARSKGRLYRSMGFLGAVFCVILLL